MKIRSKIFFLFIWLACGVAPLPAKQIALTFDKLPYMEPLGFWTPREISNLIIRVLKEQKIQAAGFLVGDKIEEKPSSYIVLEDWVKNGHILGNNTFSYVDLNELKTEDFISHVADGQRYLLRALRRPGRPKFLHFRYPMLHEGDTPSKKKDVAKRLERNGYVLVPATVLLSDYQFNHFFDQVFGDEEATARLRELYLEHLGNALDYAEVQSERVFGSQIRHILRLHFGVATANFMGDLMGYLASRDYEIVSLQEALADPLYETEETYVGPLGLSFIDRVAATLGVPFQENSDVLSRREIADRLAGSDSQD